MAYTFTPEDILFGVGPGANPETFRIYIDKSTTPFTLAVDSRLRVGGSMSSYAKIYKGSLGVQSPTVVANMYDNSGNFLTDRIPLEDVVVHNGVNYTLKLVGGSKTAYDLADGEIVVCVIYDDQNGVVAKRQLLVENTSFIRGVNESLRYVSGVSLRSPFMSLSDNRLVEFPINVPISALNLRGVVNYSDGTSFEYPIDGDKFKLFGLDTYVSTIVGQKIDLVLSYKLASNEIAYAGVTGDFHYVTEPYSLSTVNPNNSYTVKVYGYPEWVNDADGYRMRFYMTTLDRDAYYDVTPYVQFAANTGSFNPKQYGYLQRKAISLNLGDVSNSFRNFVHTQLMDIILVTPPNNVYTPWKVSHEANANRPYFGESAFARLVPGTPNQINVRAECLDLDAWLTKFYYNTYPLFDNYLESVAIRPTHFKFLYPGCNDNVHEISEWNTNIVLGVASIANRNLPIVFIKRTATGDKILSVTSCIINPYLGGV